MTTGTPTLSETLDAFLRERLSHVHTRLPAQIISYDASVQTCSCQPVTRHRQPLQGGRTALIDWPVLAEVPVGSPRWGSWFMHGPLAPGDFVELVFGESSLDRWREIGGTGVDPVFDHRFDLSDAIAVPENVYPIAAALAGLSATTFSFGKVGGPQIHMHEDGTIALGSITPIDAAAVSSKVLTELVTISNILAAVVADMAIIAVPYPAVVSTAAAFTAATAAGFPHSVASLKVKLNE